MSPSNRQTYPLTICNVPIGLKITIFNDGDQFHILEDEENYTIELPKGLYILRTERHDRILDNKLRHAQAQCYTPKVPQTASSQPLPGNLSANISQSFADLAWKCGNRDLKVHANSEHDNTPNLLLVATDLRHKDHFDCRAWQNWRLQLESGDVLTLSSETVHLHDDGAVYSTMQKPGVVVLLATDSLGVEQSIPIHLFQGFQVQLFIGFDTGVVMKSARFLMIKLDQLDFIQNNPYLDAASLFSHALIDAGLEEIQRPSDKMSSKMTWAFLNAKFSNPVLGLLGAYMMLTRWKHLNKELNSQQQETLQKVLSNLEELLPYSIDIIALKLLAAPLLPKPLNSDLCSFQSLSLRNLPMFRLGTEAIITASIDNPHWLEDDSLIDKVSDRLILDSPWTCWENEPIGTSNDDDTLTAKPKWVEFAIADYLEAGNSIKDVNDLAKYLKVTPNVINASFLSMTQRLVEQPDSMHEMGFNLRKLKTKIKTSLGPELSATLGSLKNELQNEPSYQKVYPKLKATIQLLSNSKVEVKASDDLSKLIQDEEKQSLVSNIQNRFAPLIPKNSEERIIKALNESQTVKQLADALVKHKF